MTIHSSAKINLYLDVLGKDPADGYHYIDSLFQEVSVCDEIEIKKGAGVDEITFENENITGNTTVHKALSFFKEKYSISEKFSIQVVKFIPVGAGLGGGSSNAAFVLMALAGQYGIPRLELLDIAGRIGSDVPFFFYGGLCRVEGKGEKIQPLSQKLAGAVFIIVYPNIHISTKWAYSLITDYQKDADLGQILTKSDFNIDFLTKIIYNKFQYFVFNENDRLSIINNELGRFLGSRLSFMSGSGSSLVFVYGSKQEAQKDLELLRGRFNYKTFLCDPLYR